jgi:hypothetical protein
MAIVSRPPSRRPNPGPKWTAKAIAWALATDYGSPLNYRHQYLLIPNSNTFLGWESDLLATTPAGYLTEVEIKVSAGDWRADSAKVKWYRHPALPGGAEGRLVHQAWEKVKYFWYAAPLRLAKRWEAFGIPSWAGVYGLGDEGTMRIQVVRPAQPRPGHRRLTEQEHRQLARLGAVRIWGMEQQQRHNGGKA